MILSRGLWNGQEFDLAQVRALFFSGKNRIREIWEKSGFVISGIFDQILITVYKNGQIFVEQRFFLEIFTNFDVFKIAIWPSKNIAMLKSF